MNSAMTFTALLILIKLCIGVSSDKVAETPSVCDFEEDECSWTISEYWTRTNDPRYDHTPGKNGKGHFMIIQNNGIMHSPRFNASLTEEGCFSFWYILFSDVEILEIRFTNTNEYDSTVMFTKSGDQGDEWLHGIFNLPKSKTNFQLIIQASRNSDAWFWWFRKIIIAIDDLEILQGNKCPPSDSGHNNEVTSASTTRTTKPPATEISKSTIGADPDKNQLTMPVIVAIVFGILAVIITIAVVIAMVIRLIIKEKGGGGFAPSKSSSATGYPASEDAYTEENDLYE